MDKGCSSDLNKDNVNALTYDDLLLIYEKMIDSYDTVRKQNLILKDKYSILEKNSYFIYYKIL